MWFTVVRSFQQARAEGELLNFLLRCTPSFSALFEAFSLQIRGTTSTRYERAPRRPCSGGRAGGRRNGGPRLDGASFVGGGLSSFPVLLWGSQGAWAGRELAVSPGGSVIILLLVHLIVIVCALVVKFI